MRYNNISSGIFHERINRFVAHVEVDGAVQTVHVKNTGRCRELLVPGAEVWLVRADVPEAAANCDLSDPEEPTVEPVGGEKTRRKQAGRRKTNYDLIAVRKNDGVLFNIDSQAPNRVVREWLEGQGFDRILPEHRFGQSRIDFYMERGGARWLLEVKGCTLERDGIGYFPDAPTERGTKHLWELTAAVSEGYRAVAAFVMQAESMRTVLPNRETDPAFADALEDAARAGVRILCLPCHVEPDRLEIVGELRL